MAEANPRPSRAERRRNTEARILGAARGLFAERGFERTTIRAVAADAGVDPALVMQYFGSKQELFAHAVRVSPEQRSTGGAEQLTGALLAALGMKMAGLPATSLATFRSMLTHPQAAERARSSLSEQVDQISAAIPASDARLRAALVTAITVGVVITRQLLDVPELRDADPERIAALLRGCLRALTDPTP
ncbi:MAG TPA: TetR family transcriptional regulator [Mycobacteriales bacterium]|nr:TetR family transcriptional regulator [Mycobacteriales bacterium]